MISFKQSWVIISGLNVMVMNFDEKDYDNYYLYDYLPSLVTDDDWNSWTLTENQKWNKKW